ncbi:hypothetical protein PTNB73_05680 [Pyrenophora teres f. teres]|nr:hypothetical protein PTNB73_05680 [Pyrenophora teres f. teres]
MNMNKYDLAEGTDFYLPFRATWGRYPDVFTNLDERQHAERRRIVNQVYSMSNIIQMEENMDKCVQMLMEKLAECATRTAAINISQWIQWYAFDVVGELFFSRMFGFLKGAYDHGGYIHALDLLIPLIAVACASPAYLRPLVLISGAMIPQVFKALKALKHIEDASESCVTDRQRLIESGEAGDTEDMLQSFFGIMQKKGSQKDFGITEVKMEVYGAFIAGSDTTAAAITAIVYYLMRTPSAYAKLTAEIDTASQAGLLSPIIQYHEAVGLPYLMACCKEGMRLHPSVGMTLPRQVPRGGCVVAGEWFPRSIFGNDADDFVPERWLGSQAAKMERYMFQFGGGSRTCIGKNYGVKQVIISYKTEDVSPDVLRNAEFDLNRVSMFYMDWVQTTMTLQAVTTVHMVLIRYDNIPDEFRHMSLRPRTWRGQITEFFENLENYEQP